MSLTRRAFFGYLVAPVVAAVVARDTPSPDIEIPYRRVVLHDQLATVYCDRAGELGLVYAPYVPTQRLRVVQG